MSSTFTAGNDATLSIRSGSATQYSKISIGTNTNKGTIGCPGASGTFFTDTAQGDLVIRADDNNNKVHIGAGTSGIAGMVITEAGGVGKIGIGTASPGNMLQIEGVEPYATLKNSTSENSDGGCESKIIFEDHTNVTLAQIQGSHDGASDDTKGDLIFSTHTGSALTEAMRIDSAQRVTAGGITATSGNDGDGTLAIRSGDSGQYSKISLGTDSNKVTVGVPGASGTFFTDTAAGDLVLRADDNNSKIHIGAGTSGPAAMVVTEVANVGKVGIGTVSPTAQLDVQDTTTSSASTGGHLRLSANDGAAMGDSHRLGVIEFTGAEDAGGSQTVGARIEAMTDAAWSGSENGAALYFYTTDGDASQSNTLKLDSNKKATFSGNVVTDGSVQLKEKAAAIADTAAYGQLWVKTATPNELYFTDDAGTDVQIVTAGAVAGGGGGGISSVETKTGNYTADTDDDVILCNAAALTITLPAVSGNKGQTYYIKNIHATGVVTIDADGSETIDGALKKYITTQYESLTLVCTEGTPDWAIV